MLTSISFTERYVRRTWWFVYGVWAVMTLQALIFIVLYAQVGPIVDEWEFIPAVTGEEPFWPWLWKLHNEHRFPLPRLIWLPLTQWTGDFRVGCFISLAGVSFFSLRMIGLAAKLRGRLHFADAFFPISLLHIGHWENLRMGYQIVFMMNLVLAGILLELILTTDWTNLLRRGWQAAIATLLLLGCGAGGLAFGPFMAIWLVALVAWSLTMKPRSTGRYRIWLLLLFTTAIPIYIWLYLQGYARPGHHENPIEVWRSRSKAGFQALRSALQALSMAFGPAAIGLWPVSAFIIGFTGFEAVAQMFKIFTSRVAERPRALGMLMFLASLALMAMGIGWGRCIFTENGKPGFMGLSSRYGWIVWPALGALYFQWLIYGAPRVSKWGPVVLFGIALAMLPFNIGTGIIEGRRHQELNAAWEKSVREGMPDDELIETYYPCYYGELKRRMQIGLHLLREHRIQYYEPNKDLRKK